MSTEAHHSDDLREIGRKVVTSIGRMNVYTTFWIDGDMAFLQCEQGSITEKQEEWCYKYNGEIRIYLTKQPQPHMCRNGHMIEWFCNPYGVWTCKKCYKTRNQLIVEATRERVTRKYEERKDKTVNYWKDIEKKAMQATGQGVPAGL